MIPMRDNAGEVSDLNTNVQDNDRAWRTGGQGEKNIRLDGNGIILDARGILDEPALTRMGHCGGNCRHH
jgi:hypothetical protein